MLVFENQVLLGRCLDILRQLPAAIFDSCVTDPPYGLGNHEPTPEEILAYLQGADLDTGGDFMGKDWEIPSVLVWREIHRVLKPGAHVLCFGGTRTFDLISMGARMAGFERRDTIADVHAALMWVQAQGMPKSHNISKAIDKKLGVVGHRTDGRYKYGFSEEAKRAQGAEAHSYSKGWVGDPTEVTAPGSSEAEQWEGYGTALKPCWEPILVLRKPVEGTIAENVLQHGTGGLNIDACRVRHASPEDFEKHKAMVDRLKEQGGSLGNSWKNSSDLSGANEVTTAGRWPPNVTLTHAPGCQRIGTKKIEGIDGGSTSTRRPGSYEKAKGYYNEGRVADFHHFVNEDGTETVDAWSCIEGCPVRALDEQSGDRPSTLTGRADPGARHENPGDNGGASWFGGGNSQVYADSGGLSRFYPQFEGQEPVEVPFIYTPKATKRETTLDGQIENNHPTRKPLELMKLLVRLVTPKGGIVLDPYCGSGSTLHAAYEEGMRFTGIEKDGPDAEVPSFTIATERMKLVMAKVNERRGQQDLFNLAASMGED